MYVEMTDDKMIILIVT